MKTSDYIVAFLIKQGIHDIFGYPGGMITHFMDSLDQYSAEISAHANYHEQASAMAACGWAEITGLPGVAYATSGPGATNLITGIACAYFESLPGIFITGQVNTYEQKGALGVRQKGFQETDIVSMAKPVTKAAYRVQTAAELPEVLEGAYRMAMSGRKGPVLLDIPMDVSRGEIPAVPKKVEVRQECSGKRVQESTRQIMAELRRAKRPVILAGHGISVSGCRDLFRGLVDAVGVPVVTSMIAVDLLPGKSPYSFGMIGAYGLRWANYLLNHSDCIVALGSRMDCRQTGVNKALFAPDAKILRVDIDSGELENRIHDKEAGYPLPLEALLPELLRQASETSWDFSEWLQCCNRVRYQLEAVGNKEPGNLLAEKLGQILPENITVTTDVGQNQVWIAQSMGIKERQRVLFSGGHGAMGYSLPAAIGAALATKRPVVCVCGDGGFQMNLQELQFVVRENLPVKIVLMNNRALGMIHHFQEMYFAGNYMQTDASKGFTVPDFTAIAKAYGLRSFHADSFDKLADVFADMEPAFIECSLPQSTYVFPKLGLNKPIHEQEPALPKGLLQELDRICGF